jgi:hypothetical protein
LSNKIFLLDKSYIINKEEFCNEGIRKSNVYSFDAEIYKKLLKNDIESSIADDFLNQEERKILFEQVTKWYNWYEKNNFTKEFELNGINLLSITNPFEFHLIVLPELIKISIIKKIIEQKSPEIIVTTNYLSKYVSEIIKDKNITIKLLPSKQKEKIKDDLNVKFDIGKIPISIKLSRNSYATIKRLYESILCTTLNLWHNNSKNKKTTLLLEFDPEKYEELMKELGKTEKNIVLLNWRKPAIWNRESIKIMKNTNCKVLNIKKLLTSKDSKIISELGTEYSKKLEKLWSEKVFFNELFSIGGISIWDCIKKEIINLYKKRISDYVKFLYIGKKIFKLLNVENILALNEVGETERTILKVKNNRIPNFLLKHDFSNYFLESEKILWEHENIRLIPFTSKKFLIWGNANYEYYTKNKIEQNKLMITGSPRYDKFFKMQHYQKNNKIILITPEPITEFSGLADTNLAIRYENLINKIIDSIKKIPNTKIIVKLHPGDDIHNKTLLSIFEKIDSSIPIFHIKKISELLEECDILLNITCEISDPSTVMIEGMIFEKPVFEISLDEKTNRFEYQENSPILSLSYKAEIDNYLSKIILDSEFKNELLLNQKKYLEYFLANRGTASKNVVKILDS